MPRIQANRDSIDDRFSVLGFTVRTESPLFEVAVATDPALFRPENRGRRARANFYSSRAHGVTRARRGEAVYLVPPDVLSNFVGQPRLYFGLATYRENSRGRPDFVQAPGDGSMYVSMNQLTERGLRRSVTPLEGSSYAAGSAPGARDASLDWGGDAVAEAGATPAAAPAAAPTAARTPAPAPLPPAPPMVAAAGAGYDDGFGAFPEEPAPLLAGGLELVRSYNGGLLEQLRFLAGSVAWFAGVPDTRNFPHSAICQVIDPAQGPEVERGTAFYIGRNLLLTAAHVVEGKSRLVFVPGKNGEGLDRAHEPFGRFAVNAAQWRKHESYRNGVRDFDFAIVKTPAEAPGGRWFNLLEELTQSRSEGVAVCGYSVRSNQSDLVSRLVNHTIDSRKQHLHGGAVRTVDAETFTYDIQTLPGASGSPVYWVEATTPPRVHMVGVHVAGADDVTNKGCRLTTTKIGWIRARAAEWGQASAMDVDDEALTLDAEPVADTLALALAAPTRVRVRDRTRRPARFPTVRLLNAVERAAVSTLLAALSPAAAALVRGLQLLPASHQLSVGVGPSVSAGFLVGAGVGAGLIFSSGGQVGVYGQFDLRAGLIDSASAELQVTLVQGGVEAFAGIGFAIGVEFDAGASISGQALFNAQAQFQGVSFGIGVGLGVEPLQIFLAMQAGAAQALALSADDAGASAALAAPAQAAPGSAEPVLLPAPPPVMQQPLAADDGDGDDTGAYPPVQAQAAPVVIPIVAAVVGAVFTRLLSNTGDVSWELDQMNGLKHPNDQAPANAAAFQDGPVIRLTDWPKTGGLGSIFAGFEVRWQHNGTSLGNIAIANVSSSDAMAWGLVVKARIINDSIVYPRSAPRFAGLRIRFEYRFTHSVFSDRLAYREIQLFGNGAYNMTGDWTQHTFF